MFLKTTVGPRASGSRRLARSSAQAIQSDSCRPPISDTDSSGIALIRSIRCLASSTSRRRRARSTEGRQRLSSRFGRRSYSYLRACSCRSRSCFSNRSRVHSARAGHAADFGQPLVKQAALLRQAPHGCFNPAMPRAFCCCLTPDGGVSAALAPGAFERLTPTWSDCRWRSRGAEGGR